MVMLKKETDGRRVVPKYQKSAQKYSGLLSVKIALREYFLKKYHSGKPPIVFDACRGPGEIWDTLMQKFSIGSYWGVDRDYYPGIMKIDSTRVLASPGWDFDIVDIDTYGPPWMHWMALVQNLEKPLTVFLTHGFVTFGALGATKAITKAEKFVLGMRFQTIKPPQGVLYKIGNRFAVDAMLSLVDIEEAIEAFPQPRDVRYIGVRIKPKDG